MTTISSLTALTGAGVDAAVDLLPIVDMSLAGTSRNKKILVSELKLSFNLGTAADLDIDTDDTLAADSDSLIPTQQAVKAYVDANVGSGGIDVEDEGVSEATGATILNFVGAGVTAADVGGGQVDITIPGGGGGIDIEDEGVSEATGAGTLNFIGAGVTATDAGGGVVDITIPGGSSSTTVASIVMGTTAGTPGTGAFTPNAASGNYRAWSTIAAGWVGIVRFVDGSDWEVAYSYWDGTTLSRASTQLIASSTGSAISLTSSATAELMQGGLLPLETARDTMPWRGVMASPNANTMPALGTSAATAIGSVAAAAIASTNYLTEQPRCQFTSATTANAQAALHNSQLLALHSTTAERGGYLIHFQFGASQIPTGPRVFMGLTGTTFAANTGEPSALVASYAVLGKDSGDTNLQFLCNSGSGAGTKIDTGIALVANGWYEVVIYSPKGGATVHMVLCRRDTGAVFYSSTSSDIPATGTGLMHNMIAGLSSTTGTAMVLHLGNVLCRAGF